VEGVEGRKRWSERRLPPRSLDGLSLGLLCLLLLVSGLGASRSGWGGPLRIVPVVAVLAVLAGAALAPSRFGWRRAAVFAAEYGVFVVGWQLARTLDAALTWRERLLLIGARVEIYADVLLRGDRNQDPLMFVFLLARHVAARRAAWDKMRTEIPVRGGRPITQAGLLAAILLVALAWGGPAFARSETAADLWTRLGRPWPPLRDGGGELSG